MNTDELQIWVDGTASYNIPGRPKSGNNARIGSMYSLWAGNTCLEEVYREIGAGTVNQAEFVGVIIGLAAGLKYKPSKIVIYSDSQIVVNAITNRNLGCSVVGASEWIPAIYEAIEPLESFKLVWIKRHKNRADGLNRKLAKEADAQP